MVRLPLLFSAEPGPNSSQILREECSVERLRMQFQRRRLENRPIPLHILSSRCSHHRGRFRCGFRMEVWNGEGHGGRSVMKMTRAREDCAESFSEKIGVTGSESLSKTRTVMGREWKLVAELIRRRQSGCAKKRLSGGGVGPRHHLDRLALPLSGGRVQAEEMAREVHRWGFLNGVGPWYRHVAAIG